MDDIAGLTPELISKLLSHTKGLLNHVYWVKHDFNLQPNRDHVGSSINFTDIKCRKDDFLRELVNTIACWVYSKAKVRELIDSKLAEVNFDYGNASSFLTTQAFSKFRPGHPQGQFGELLLFNFIQFFFKAVPLLRKMRITTSAGHERFGADAIHLKKEDQKIVLILGESKCYESKYKFKTAFSTSLASIVNTFQSFDKELDLYTYDDFLEPELESFAKKYKKGEVKDVYFELVCLVAYNETKKIGGSNEAEIKKSIQTIIGDRCGSLEKTLFSSVEKRLLDRINYIIFPIWQLDSFLAEFGKVIGVKHESIC